jgi:hypothetical protein
MVSIDRTDDARLVEAGAGVSWASIAAGAVVAAATTLILLALGAGLGLSSISPWAGSGVSAGTFKIGTGIYLVLVAVMSSAVGGYLAARLRTKWVGIHANEAFFRDTAHGLIAWAFATVISATVLAGAATSMVGGLASGLAPAAAQGAASINPSQLYVDRLFRNEGGAAPNTANAAQGDAVRAEVLRLWTSDFRDGSDISTNNRTYLARLVSAQTGLSQAEAEKRVNDTVTEAKAAADRARSAAAKLAFFTAAMLLFGAFAASLAAVEGGQLRDGTWQDRRLVPRPW